MGAESEGEPTIPTVPDPSPEANRKGFPARRIDQERVRANSLEPEFPTAKGVIQTRLFQGAASRPRPGPRSSGTL